MSTPLSRADLLQLRATLTALLTPLDDADPAEWRRRVSSAIHNLIGSDGCGVMLRSQGEVLVTYAGEWGQAAQVSVDTFTSRYWGRNPVDHLRRQRGVRVWSRHGLWPRTDALRSAYYNEFCRPHGILDSAGMTAGPLPGDIEEAVALVSSTRPDRFAPEGREVLLLQLLQPAFGAGVTMLAMARSWGDALGRAVDLAGTALAILRPDGELLHATPALLALVAGDREGGRLLTTAQALSRRLAPLLARTGPADPPPPTDQAVTLDSGRYELRAALARPGHIASGPVVLVAVLPPGSARTLSHQELRVRFGLTGREAEVAEQLARGERDRAIAATLGISVSTARRHVEHVLGKLGVHTRAAVAHRLRS